MLIKLSRFDEERRREKSEDDEEDEAAAAAAMRWGLPPLPSVSLLGFVSYQLWPILRGENHDDMDCQGLPAMASSSKVGLSEPEPEEHHQNTFFEFVVPGVLLNGVGLLGLVGNILSIIVLSRPQMKSSINCILIGTYL